MRRLETWINNSLVIVDVDDVWSEEFARWDCMVDSDLAADIATLVAEYLRREYEARNPTPVALSEIELENLYTELG